MKLGDFEIISLYENSFRIDGGAMFGIIPKKIWSRLMPSDDENFLVLNIRPLLIKTGRNNVIIDVGFGDTLDEKMKKVYGIDQPSQLVSSLEKAGMKPEDVDTVIFTHLHADHALGGLRFDEQGKITKTFPNAVHYAHKFEIEDAFNPNERTAATYVTKLLSHYGEIQPVEADGEIVPGVSVQHTGGHTRGHMIVLVESGGQTLVYPADIVPTALHLRPAFVGAIDVFPLDSLKVKKPLIRKCLDEGWYVAFDHDPEICFGKLVERESPRGKEIVAIPVE